MKKVALALLVLAITIPAMATVQITATQGTLTDANKVTIGYNCNSGEEVRAFALNVAVDGKNFVVGSGKQVGDPNHINYWVYPGTMTFTVVDGNTVVDNFGNPLVEQDVNGAVVEMASLYAPSDPCHPSAPPSGGSGSLCYFYVKCGNANTFNVTVTANTKRGGIVLKDPNAVAATNLPKILAVVCPSQGPHCWVCARQKFGDATGDGSVNLNDLLALRKAWGKSTGQVGYNCCADFTQDGSVNLNDLLILRKNWGTTGATCADISCP